MNILFAAEAWSQYNYWQKEDKKVVSRINDLLKNIQRNPYQGIGKPEPLRHEYKGYWSRRINKEHRLVYRIVGDNESSQRIEVLACKFHYKK